MSVAKRAHISDIIHLFRYCIWYIVDIYFLVEKYNKTMCRVNIIVDGIFKKRIERRVTLTLSSQSESFNEQNVKVNNRLRLTRCRLLFPFLFFSVLFCSWTKSSFSQMMIIFHISHSEFHSCNICVCVCCVYSRELCRITNEINTFGLSHSFSMHLTHFCVYLFKIFILLVHSLWERVESQSTRLTNDWWMSFVRWFVRLLSCSFWNVRPLFDTWKYQICDMIYNSFGWKWTET